MSSYTYKIHHLPQSTSTTNPALLPFLAGKFASLRLAALTTSPTAFSSTFNHESQFTSSQCISRLQRPLVHTFIAIAYSPTTAPSKQTIETGDFIGTATLLGPIPKAVYEIPESGGPVIRSEEQETRWQMTAIYSSPSHRGKGIAKMLINAAMDFAAQQGGKEEGKKCRVRIMIHPRNVDIKKLYEGLGFVDAGKATLAEAYRANGEEEFLPADGGASDPEKYHSRLGLIIERVF